MKRGPAAVRLPMVGMIVGLSAITAWGVGRFHLMVAGLTMEDIANDPQRVVTSALALFRDFFLAAALICLMAIIPALWLVASPCARLSKAEDNLASHDTPG
jgi:hypothetical protein